MKKSWSILLSFILVVFLAACNQTADPVNEEGNKENANESKKSTEESKSNLTLEEVFEKTNKASQEITSLKSNMTLNQTMTMPGEEGEMKINSDVTSSIVMEPLALHQTMKMTMEGDAAEAPMQDMTMDSYLTKDGFYMKDSSQNKWMKMPKELSDQIVQMSNAQTDPSKQLKDLQQFMEDFKFEQDDKHFILKLTANGEKFQDFLQKQMKEIMPEMLPEEAMNNMSYDEVKYEIYIDKETFYTTKLNSTVNMTIKVEEGKEMKTQTEMSGTYSDYNEIEAITVPKEVVETAEEVSL
ncbi:hypothetical protein JOC86_004963 [Bacillus pakistanensis]|uniref:Lipoprotein n=1 Tax=Rossellomorea pakistanensis TaxID=992288 RepID=A0ABS2NKJ5_9BACI|nr:DUF6612 family protein [Bacillus pakistanensis]MBM7588365.1 hypothetical protein [Bacillus pakistanensis]